MATRTTSLPSASSLTEVLGHDGSNHTSRFALALGAGTITLSGFSSNANQGVVYFGNTGNNYCYFDGSAYNFPTSPITNLGSAVLTKSTATVGVSVILDGGGSTLTTSNKADIEVPFAATITAAKAYADQTGSITVTVKRAASGAFPPTNSIVASAPITISSSTSGSSALTGWTTSLAANDTLRFELSSITAITRLTVALTLTRA